jgi:hypothetical protein
MRRPQMTGKRDLDWVTIKAIYRIGHLSNREIARRHGLTEKAIRLRAKAENWVRDLRAEVAAGVKEAVVRSNSAETAKCAGDVVRAAIEEGKQVVLKHQRLGTRLSENAQRLADIIHARINAAENVDAKDLNFLARANYSCTAAAQTAIAIERQARGLDAVTTDPNAPPAISITYYRSDLIQQVHVGGASSGGS